jgi:hypothetical protein
MQRIGIIVAMCLLSACSFAHAQEQDQEQARTQRMFGVGISLNPTSLIATDEGTQLFLPVGTTNIRLALTPSPNFRIEPEFGIYSSEREASLSGITGPSTSQTESFSSTRLGISLFYRAPVAESFAILVGPRAGFVWLSSEEKVTGTDPESESTSESDFYAGAALGGEYMLSNNFGIGAEAQLNYVSLGEPETKSTSGGTDPGPRISLSRSLITSNALVFIHFYF